MKEHTVKCKHIMAALCISLILCTGITFVFWGAEKKNVAEGGCCIMDKTERTENIVS